MKKLMPWIIALAALPLLAQDLTGTWQGLISAGRDLRIVMKISKADGDGLKAVMYSIDQGPQGMASSAFTVLGSSITISIAAVAGTYEGKLNAEGTSIAGAFTQGNRSLPLNLVRSSGETAWALPDPPARLQPMRGDISPTFEAVTIRPSKPETQGRGVAVRVRRFSAVNTTLSYLIGYAYGLQARQITGGPAWMDTERYDLEAQPEEQGDPSTLQWKVMVQRLLADRFQLAFHREKKEIPVYAMVVSKNGPKLSKSEGDPDRLGSLAFRQLGVLPARNATMADFASAMQMAVLDRPVLDQTGLSGRYDFTLMWTPDEAQFTRLGMKAPPRTEDPAAPPDLFTAIQQQLGLKLEPTKAITEILVIDYAEMPSDN